MNTSNGRRKGGSVGRWQLPAAAAASTAAAVQRKTWQREAVKLACGAEDGDGVIAHRPGSSRSLAFEWDDATVDCR